MDVLRIKDGVVVNVELWDELPESDGEFSFVEAVKEVSIGWSFDGSEFSTTDYDPEVHYEQAIRIAADGTVLERLPEAPANTDA